MTDVAAPRAPTPGPVAPAGVLVSVNVGLPRDVAWAGRTVHTGIWKAPVTGRRHLGRLDLDGDGQGDLGGHGGPNRAVLVYQQASYAHWAATLGRTDLAPGHFGENFTVEGLADDVVCIGDRYRVGSALVEVSQPRVTCYRLGLRLGEPRMPALLTSGGRPGFYLRVLEEGDVGAGDALELVARGPEAMTVAEVNALLYLPPHPRDQLERALRIPALSAGWRGSFEALLEASRDPSRRSGNAGLAAPTPAASPGFRPVRVAARVLECDDVVSLVLEPTDGRPLEPTRPGQFVVVRLPSGSAAPPLVRSYSISGPVDPARVRISIRVAGEGRAARLVRDGFAVGAALEASGPRGSFGLTPGAGPVVFLGGGIGATPLVSMLHALARERSARPVTWIQGARDGRTHPFAAEVRTLLSELPAARAHVRYSRPGPEDVARGACDSMGHVDVALVRALGVAAESDFFLCGPPAFVNDLRAGLAEWGVPPARVHVELFDGGAGFTPGIAGAPAVAPHPPRRPEATGPAVAFARSGLTVRWDAARDGTLLELAEACDVPVRWSCRTGVCHTCETGLVSGTVTYDPTPLDAPAEGSCLPCCARPAGDVVLDL